MGFVVGVWLSPRHKAISTSSTIDTVVYYKPLPVNSTIAEVRTLSFPKLLFAPADTVVKTTTIFVEGDSVRLDIPVERREYRDSSYYAVVSGAVVGDIRPTLDLIEVYNRSTTIEVKPPTFRPYVSGSVGKSSIGAGVGAFINRHGIGADYYYINGQSYVMARYSFLIR